MQFPNVLLLIISKLPYPRSNIRQRTFTFSLFAAILPTLHLQQVWLILNVWNYPLPPSVHQVATVTSKWTALLWMGHRRMLYSRTLCVLPEKGSVTIRHYSVSLKRLMHYLNNSPPPACAFSSTRLILVLWPMKPWDLKRRVLMSQKLVVNGSFHFLPLLRFSYNPN